MIIGVCGFASTGSSAVLDYLKEFDSVCTLDNKEFVLSYYPDGLEDLEYHLFDGASKFETSVVAIERFRRFIYCYFIRTARSDKEKQAIYEASEEFIDSIVHAKWKGYGASDYQLNCGKNYKSPFSMFTYKLMYAHVLPRLKKISDKDFDSVLRHDMEFSMAPVNYIEAASKLVNSFIRIYGGDFSKPIALNQSFCGNNPMKSYRYFGESKSIVVDRDPRDNYLFAKKFLRGRMRQIPSDDVKTFVSYYRHLRDGQPYKNGDPSILRIQFEDMVYRYDDTVKIINDFCYLNPSDRVREYFVPADSMNNTQVFKRFPNYEDDIKFIEDNLTEYLYPFERFGDVSFRGHMFYGRSPLNK